jgi:hypothetical protein
MRQYYLYILASISRVLYIGVTSDFEDWRSIARMPIRAHSRRGTTSRDWSTLKSTRESKMPSRVKNR